MAANTRNLQPWFREWVEYALAVMQYNTGGQLMPDGSVRGGIRPTITSGYRSIADQTRLWNARASNPYPVARPGESAHNFGMAFDSSVPEAYKPTWKYIREYLGFRVPADDIVHAEVPNWRSYVS